jgi:Lar family restriction alleviation protein
MDKQRMLPCPFCGDDMSLVTWLGNETGSLQEMEGPLCVCGVQGSMYPTRAEAITAWNTRAHAGDTQ